VSIFNTPATVSALMTNVRHTLYVIAKANKTLLCLVKSLSAATQLLPRLQAHSVHEVLISGSGRNPIHFHMNHVQIIEVPIANFDGLPAIWHQPGKHCC
jgi:hypothetical protein